MEHRDHALRPGRVAGGARPGGRTSSGDARHSSPASRSTRAPSLPDDDRCWLPACSTRRPGAGPGQPADADQPVFGLHVVQLDMDYMRDADAAGAGASGTSATRTATATAWPSSTPPISDASSTGRIRGSARRRGASGRGRTALRRLPRSVRVPARRPSRRGAVEDRTAAVGAGWPPTGRASADGDGADGRRDSTRTSAAGGCSSSTRADRSRRRSAASAGATSASASAS